MAINIQRVGSSYAALTISLASLATSTAGVGRQSTIVNNSTTKYDYALLNVLIKLGTSPTANKSVYVYLIQSNGTNRTDGAGASDAALTIKNAALIGIMTTGSAPGTGDNLRKTFNVEGLGQEWGIAIVHDSAVNLDSTGGNHVLTWAGYKYELVSS